MGSEKDVSTQMRYFRVLYIQHTMIAALSKKLHPVRAQRLVNHPQIHNDLLIDKQEKCRNHILHVPIELIKLLPLP